MPKACTCCQAVIDSQVHFREPGLEHKEDLETGARSAALGGVCAVFEMPNTNPSTTTPDLLLDKLERAKRMDIDHAFYAGATKEKPASAGRDGADARLLWGEGVYGVVNWLIAGG